MKPYYSHAGIVIHAGDCLSVMPTLDADSIDAIVTDPPYGIGFMGKAWDHGVPGVEFWIEALRVAKPGAHLVAFGGTRTFHRLTCAIEDVGWEIRDCLSWLYGSGFPKSLDVSKAIDKAAGATREVIGPNPNCRPNMVRVDAAVLSPRVDAPLSSPATDAAREWQGWGTALKPGWEPCIVARKPLAGTVAANVQQHGTGALNVDGCRIGTGGQLQWSTPRDMGYRGGADFEGTATRNDSGRWPANVCLDEDAAAMLDEQSGVSKSPPVGSVAVKRALIGQKSKGDEQARVSPNGHGDTGGASRFFYTAKASKADRFSEAEGGNDHPTVKPLALMQWLCTLVTPPGGLILDPFMGSGSTLKAAKTLGFRAIGIDLEERHAEIAAQRLSQEVLAL